MRRTLAAVSVAGVFVFRRAVGRVGNCWAKMPALTGISHPKPSRRLARGHDDDETRADGGFREKRPIARGLGVRAPSIVLSSDCWTRTSDPAVNSRLLYQLS